MCAQTFSYTRASCFQSAYFTWRERYTMYASDDDWDEFLLTDINLCLKYAKRWRRWMHQLWEPRSDGEYFELCKTLREIPDKFKEYSMVNIRTFNYILDRVNPLTPNDHYSGRTAPLTSKRCILYIYSTNIGTEYFKHGIYFPFFLFKMQFVS